MNTIAAVVGYVVVSSIIMLTVIILNADSASPLVM